MDISNINDDKVLEDLEKSLEMIIERETRALNKVKQRRAAIASNGGEPKREDNPAELQR